MSKPEKRLLAITAHLADMHIGNSSISVEEFRDQFNEFIYKPLKALPYLDIIFIEGDLSHSRMNVNNPYNILQIWVVNKLFKLCKKKSAAFVILDGTRSHDDDQNDQFLHLESNDEGVYFRIIKTFEVLENVGGLSKILCLPHKYPQDKDDIEKFFKDKYDLVVGHGTIDKMKHFVQESENKPVKEYCYSLDTLHEIAKGPIYFGHIHPHTVYRRFTYVGSFTKLERGNNSDHGFMICIQNRENTAQYQHLFIPNLKTKNYINIQISRNQLHEMDISDLVRYIEHDLKPAQANDLISISIMSGGDKFSADKVLIIKETYKRDNRIKINIKVKSETVEAMERKNGELRDRYGYLLDPNLDEAEILYRFYQDEMSNTNEIPKDIPIDLDIIKVAIK